MFNTKQIIMILIIWFGLSFGFGIMSYGTPMGSTDANAMYVLFQPLSGVSGSWTTFLLNPSWWGALISSFWFDFPIFDPSIWAQGWYVQAFLRILSLGVLVGMFGQMAGQAINGVAGIVKSIANIF